ncbi:MAG: ribosomal protein S18-alanine N-acetyltransferase [Marinobacter sp.]|uniref:ribosomal protein S18-alanine N-acetyltransferase n=1 Tax=Marinobacter sp. TaxID=50741 RepID=UPI00299D4FA3|nr:ribosomal protein S18-alanine N-acetyltransferase [Marinobacter sp.]MDX1757894.1 ribosomal protein S18-alanine N-acetyltransferase [Marinobacter sp.]
MIPDTYQAILDLGLHVRSLREADLPAVLEVERRSYSHPWSEGGFRDCFHPNYRSWLMLDGDRLAGYAVVAYQYDEAHLLNICIAPDHRRQGAGRKLLRHVVAMSAHDGMALVLLEVRVSNLSAINLYASEGFQPVGERPEYYPAAEGREAAKVMTLTLPSVHSPQNL